MITGEATPGEIIKRSNPHPNFGSEDQKLPAMLKILESIVSYYVSFTLIFKNFF